MDSLNGIRGRSCFQTIRASASIGPPPSSPICQSLNSRSSSETPRERWETDAKKPIAIVIDGTRHAMKSHQAEVSEDGMNVARVSVGRQARR